MTPSRLPDVLKVLQADGAVRLGHGDELAVRTYRGYEGRNPRTGAVVHVPTKRLPLVQEATDEAVDLGLDERVIAPGSPVWHVPDVGLLVGDVAPRTLLSFVGLRLALNDSAALARFASEDAVLAALEPLPSPVDYLAKRAGGGASPTPLMTRAVTLLAGRTIPPFDFLTPETSGLPGVAFASLGRLSWRLLVEGDHPSVLETSEEPFERLSLATFLDQASLLVSVTEACQASGRELPLSERMAVEVVRAMLARERTPTRILTSLQL